MQAHLLEIWRKIDITIVFITHDLDEAILLADRILVLSAHPGRVQELIEVPVPRPRGIAQIVTLPFLATKARLEELIYTAAAAPAASGPSAASGSSAVSGPSATSAAPAGEQGEDYPVLARMTDVTDNVE
jgi:NitT/TauT family transport system ATP-binding protein